MRSFSLLFGMVLITASLLAQSKNQEPKDFNEVVSRMAAQIVETNKTSRPQRLAVVAFISTKSGSSDSKNEFGEYLTESTITALNIKKNVFKLFERKRLDVILRENDLNLTDLVDQSQAKKVGELLPIDVLLSGTYTKLKNYIDVNSRLLDVVTGEILVGFSGRIKMTADLESLFPDETGPSGQTTNIESELDRCKEKAKSLQTLLNDLSSDDKINRIVNEAVKIPFDRQCGVVHFDVVYSFQRYKIDKPLYKKFLMNTLDTIAFPGNDERGQVIIEYLVSDKKLDDAEWALGLKTMKKIGNYRLNIFVRRLLNPVPLPENLDEIQSRIDEFCSAVRAGQVGLPKPMSFNAAFFQLMDGLKNDKDGRLVIYAYDKYARNLEWDTKTFGKVNALLTGVYKNERNADRKTMLIRWLADFYNQSEKSDASAEDMYEFVRHFEPNEYNKDEIKQTHPEKDLQLLVDLCKAKFTDYAVMTKYNSQLEDRINFCVRYDIPIPGVIPTMSEAAKILEGTDWPERLRVIALLEKMGSRPKAIEPVLLKLLDARNIEHKNDLQKIQESVLVILGHIQSSHPKAIEAMVNSLTSYESMLPEKATEALVHIGKESVPYLLKKLRALQADDGGYQYKIIAILGRIGKDARAAKPDLQNLLQRTTNHDVKYAIEAALQAIE
jgi:TolB-like protein